MFIALLSIIFVSFLLPVGVFADTSTSKVYVVNPTSEPTATLTPTQTLTPTPTTVNHPPVFTYLTYNSQAEVDSYITWISTASDPDANDMVKIVVCSSPNLVSGVCQDNTLCQSGYVAGNPTCSYNIPYGTLPGDITAYAFIVDKHGTPALDTNNISATQFSVQNSGPLASNIILNQHRPIFLTEGSTTQVDVVSIILDPNGCSDIFSVEASLYRSGLSYDNCNLLSQNNSHSCFSNLICRPSSACSDSAYQNYTCTFDLPYYTDPTDINTPYQDQEWLATIKVQDKYLASDITHAGRGVELISLVAMEILNHSASSNPAFTREISFIPTGNVGLDLDISSSGQYQKFTTRSNSSWDNSLQISSTNQEVELDIPKPNSLGQSDNNKLWWGLSLPSSETAANYKSTTNFFAVRGEVGQW